VVYDDSTGDLKFLGISSQPLGSKSSSEWITTVASDPGWDDTCATTSEPLTVDGATDRMVTQCPDSDVVSALVAKGGRGYLWSSTGVGDKEWFRQIVETATLDAAPATDKRPSASP
jgi:hypothetical protein